jgi:hypothetical protein
MSQQQFLELDLNILIRMRTYLRWFVMISKLLSKFGQPLMKVRNRLRPMYRDNKRRKVST